jgi:hypothetical protein
MNQRADIWNILHDGEIAEIKRDSQQNLQLRIYIPYLGNMFPEVGENIWVDLHNTKKFEMRIWDEDLTTSDFDKIVSTGTEILSTESTDVPLHIVSTRGDLFIDFESFSLSLDSKNKITFDELTDACSRYWKNLEEMYKK